MADHFGMLRLAFLAALFLASSPARVEGLVSQQIDAPPHIIFLHSYHIGYHWTDEIHAAALEALRQRLPDATYDVIFMDWKRYPKQETIDDLASTIAHRYSGRKVSLVITSDDAALSFAMKYRASLLGNPPVVFTGVFQSAEAALTGLQPGVTGVYESVDLEGTIAAATKVLPKARSIYIIHDGSETSLSMKANIDRILDGMGSPLERVVLGRMVFEELLERLSRIPPNDIVLLASYASDPQGLNLQPRTFARMMSERSTAPLFVLYSHLMGTGAFGGSVLDGQLQGEAAVELGQRILGGTPAENLPRVDRKTVRLAFDYGQMLRFGIEEKNLPAEAALVNKPFSFFEQYRGLVIAVALVLVLLSSLVAFLAASIIARRKVERDLRKSNSAIAALNAELEERVTRRTEELSKSNAELGRTLKELEASREAMIQNEKLLAIGRLAADVAHELNTPLGAMLSAANVLDFGLHELQEFYSHSYEFSPEEKACEDRLFALAGEIEGPIDPAKIRKIGRTLETLIDTLGGDPSLAAPLAELGYAPDPEELGTWLSLGKFALIVKAASAFRTGVEAQWIIRQSASRASQAVSALKRHAYDDRSELRIVPVNLAEELESVLTLFQAKMRQGVETEKRFGDAPTILSSPESLSKVWINLIDNALHAMDYRGKLSIGIVREGEWVAVNIGDTGPGIPEAIQDKVFAPFFTTKPRGESTGLGLDISRRVLARIGGSIAFSTSPAGTTFTVRLRVAGPDEMA